MYKYLLERIRVGLGSKPIVISSNFIGSLAVLAVLGIALFLRVWGWRFGLPHLFHPDEWAIVDPGMMILRTSDFNPKNFQYPSLYIYCEAAIFALRFLYGAMKGQFQDITTVAIPGMYAWGRLFTALIGTANVFIIYKAGSKLFGRTTGIVSALFLAVAFLHVRDSHYITVDVPATMLATLSFLFACGILKTQKSKYYILSGLAAGLATGTKWNTIPILICLLFAHLLVYARNEPINGKLFTGLGAFAAGLFMATPYAFIDMPDFLSTFGGVLAHYRGGHPGYEARIPILFYLKNIASSEGASILMAIAAFGGIITCLIREKTTAVFLLSFPVIYLMLISLSRVTFPRTALPLYPFVALLAAYFIRETSRVLKVRFRLSRLATTVLILGLALTISIPSLVRSAQFDMDSSTISTKEAAGLWISEHIQKGSKIAVDYYGPPVSNEYDVRQFMFLDHSYEWFRARHFDYVIFDSSNYQRLYDEPARYSKEIRKYDRLLLLGRIEKIFPANPYVELFLSPEIRIVKVLEK